MTEIKVELVENRDDDLHVVNAARVSFDKESKEFTYREDVPKGSDEGLVKYLAKHDHWTPFSHVRFTFIFPSNHLLGRGIKPEDLTGSVVKPYGECHAKCRHSLYGWAQWIKKGFISPEVAGDIEDVLTYFAPECSEALGLLGDPFSNPSNVRYVPNSEETDPDFIDVTLRETVPIFVARQRFKHMVGFTYNEVSRRYVDDEPEFCVPDSWRSRPEGSVKQGSGGDVVETLTWTDSNGEACVDGPEYAYEEHCEGALRLYEDMLMSGVAPEQARMVLPQSMMTSYFVTGSLSAFARMVKQRKDVHAQKEIQDLALKVEAIISHLYPKQWEELFNDSTDSNA